jgi:hypothetical protein
VFMCGRASAQNTAIVSGPTAEGQTPTRNPIWIVSRRADGTLQAIRVDNDGTLRIDPTGTTTQPVTVTNAIPLPAGAATETTLAGVKTGTDRIPSSPATDRATAAAPFACRLTDGAAFFKPTTPSDTQPISGTVTANAGTGTFTVDVSDRGGRLLGIVYGSQSQRIQQTATDFNLKTELFTGPTAYDARQVRALTASDVVTTNQGTANATPWNFNLSQVGGSAIAKGQTTMSGSIPVVLPSDQSTLPVNVGTSDPCQDPRQAKSFKALSLASTTATAIVASVASQVVYVCGVAYTLSGTAPTSLWTSAATCGTSPTNLTGTMVPTTGTEIQMGFGGHISFQNTAGQNLCLTLAGTSPSAQGVLTYVQK